MLTSRIVLAATIVCLATGIPSPPPAFGQTRDGAGQPFGQPARDTSAPELDQTTGSATLSGRVLRGDTGAVVKRAIVSLASQSTRDSRTVQTDDAGRYVFADLDAGQYTVTVSKAGFITLAYGQTHPRQPALPIRVDAGRQLRDVDIALPRGSVITGQAVDEDGEPMLGALVEVLRYVYRQGQRQIETAGTGQTDDRGQFRVFDLEPGQYYVGLTLPHRVVEDPDPVGFAPTYYPGVTMLREATPLTLGLSQEMSGVSFATQLVRMARVGGLVLGPDGSPARGTFVSLISLDRTLGFSEEELVDRDGYFEVRSVPPGSYAVQALPGFGQQDSDQAFARQEITVNGQDITDLTMQLRHGAQIRGTLTFDGNQMPDPSDLEPLRVTTSPLNPTPFEQTSDASVEADGSFVLRDIGGGVRLIRMNRLPGGLHLKAVYVEGRDVIDAPRDFRAGQTISGVTLVLTDQITELAGMVHDDRGAALTQFTVIAFPTDDALWQPQSRHIMASRPDQSAQYRFRGLPPGDYLISVVEVVEQGEWFDPRFLDDLRRRAVRVTLRNGESKSLNLGLETPQ